MKKNVTLIFAEVDGEEVAVPDTIRLTNADAVAVSEFAHDRLAAIRARIERTRTYCGTLEADNAERLQLEEQIDLLLWAIAEKKEDELNAI